MLKDSIWRKALDQAAEAIVVADEKDAFLYKNQAAEKLFSLLKWEYLKLLADPGADVKKVVKMGGKTLQVSVQACRLDQAPVKIWYIEDRTEEEVRNQKLQLLDAIVDSISEGVIASNPEGKIVLYNKWLEMLEGRERKEILGKHITEVYDVTPETSEQLTVLETGKPIIDVNLNYIANKKEMHIVSSTFPLKDNGDTIAVYSVSRDITGIRRLLLRTVEIQDKMRSNSGKAALNNGTTFTFADIVGQSDSVKQVIKESQKAAISPSPVLLYGETGTGKELFVQGIHNAGTSRNEPFVAINCAAIPESLLESLLFGTVKGAFTGAEDTKGLFEQAGKGTLYLDEINSMSVRLQAKTLRVFQEKKIRRVGAQLEIPIHCRIISSTNVEPWQCVEKGTLRKDLFYRLAVIQIVLLPLRERIEDIEVLAEHFIKKYGRIYGKHDVKISEHLLNLFKQHSWPGNVRELEHIIENSLAMMEDDEDELTVFNMPYPLLSRSNKKFRKSLQGKLTTLAEILADVERKTILNSLTLHNWNVTQAARYIGIGRQNLQYRISKLGIKRPETHPHEEAGDDHEG